MTKNNEYLLKNLIKKKGVRERLGMLDLILVQLKEKKKKMCIKKNEEEKRNEEEKMMLASEQCDVL